MTTGYYESADPVSQELAAVTSEDHARASQRGDRCSEVSDVAITNLIGRGLIDADLRRQVYLVIQSAVADVFYQNVAIDFPPYRGAK